MDRLVRGGSSPLGRIRKALQIRAFVVKGGLREARGDCSVCANGTAEQFAEHFVCRLFGDGKPFDRTTVSRDWHKAALQDADLRDMPLHALRHTAAAAWLAGGNSLKYVQDQLGHGDIRTTERYYGHLERHVKKEGAKATEATIARAGTR